MKPHTISVILAFGAVMWAFGYYTSISQGWSYVPLAGALVLATIFGVFGIATYHD